jgi:hypothetical protein
LILKFPTIVGIKLPSISSGVWLTHILFVVVIFAFIALTVYLVFFLLLLPFLSKFSDAIRE